MATNRIGKAEIKETINSGSNLDDVIHLLNFLEEVSIAAADDIGDRALLKDFYAEIVNQVWKALELWIQHYRKERDSAEVWKGLEFIHKEWARTK